MKENQFQLEKAFNGCGGQFNASSDMLLMLMSCSKQRKSVVLQDYVMPILWISRAERKPRLQLSPQNGNFFTFARRRRRWSSLKNSRAAA